MNKLKDLPSVDTLLSEPQLSRLDIRHEYLVQIARLVLALARTRIKSASPVPTHDELVEAVTKQVHSLSRPGIQPVINATGVILHTNLGRAPVAAKAIAAAAQTASDYANLEYDLATGRRGQRLTGVEAKLTFLTGAEAAIVVNNNAAALLLMLSALARRKQVIISRTQMIEIGDGFRIPDIMRQSGSKLVEVGSTNKVNLDDFESAITPATAALLRAHHSNYKIIGFTAEPTLKEMVTLAHDHGLLLLDDLGSGTLMDTAQYGLHHEPTVQESVKAGADIVCFSGDKLLGGPQAGIIVGTKAAVDRLRKHPLMRAVRADKVILTMLEATLALYLKPNADWDIPVWKMVSATLSSLESRVKRWQILLGFGEIREGFSTVGGGSLPEETLPTYLLAIPTAKPDAVLGWLRSADTPVIARIDDDAVVFDPRTVRDEDEDTLIATLKTIQNRLGY